MSIVRSVQLLCKWNKSWPVFSITNASATKNTHNLEGVWTKREKELILYYDKNVFGRWPLCSIFMKFHKQNISYTYKKRSNHYYVHDIIMKRKTRHLSNDIHMLLTAREVNKWFIIWRNQQNSGLIWPWWIVNFSCVCQRLQQCKHEQSAQLLKYCKHVLYLNERRWTYAR